MPPPPFLQRTIVEELAFLSHPALNSACHRRRLRCWVMHRMERHYQQIWPVTRSIMADTMAKWQQEGYHLDTSRIRKFAEVEAEIEKETNEHYAHLEDSNDLLQAFPFISPFRKHDMVALLFEFALTGGSQNKPKIRRNSGIWAALGFSPDELDSLPPEGAVRVIVSRLFKLLGISEAPDELAFARMVRWLMKTHLPREQEPETTPEAMSKAIAAGLIHRGYEVRDKDTGEVDETVVEDPAATRFIREVEERDELDRLVCRVELSPGERLVLMGILEGMEGEALAEWVEGQGAGVSRASVPVLKSRLVSRLREAGKS